MIGQLLIARPVIAIILGKAAIFHHGLNGHRVDNYEAHFAWFQLQSIKKKGIKAEAEE